MVIISMSKCCVKNANAAIKSMLLHMVYFLHWRANKQCIFANASQPSQKKSFKSVQTALFF